MAVDELVLWFLGIIVSFVSGFFISWYFDRKQRIFYQYVDAKIRIGNSKDAIIIKKPDGTLTVEWKKESNDSLGFSPSLETKYTKGNQPN